MKTEYRKETTRKIEKKEKKKTVTCHARQGTEGSSEEGHRADALALGAEERRDKLRKAAGSGKYTTIRRCLNGETHIRRPYVPYAEHIGMRGEPGELKHLSSRRKRKKHRFPK